jgi:GNAT superfamily N-acetyltransferase
MNGPRIEAFTPADQDAVRALILDGLRERWGRLDPSLNADLDDIARSYDGAVVLVARLDGRVVGTGTLVRRGDVGEIVRMSVVPAVRRHGIGRALVDALLDAARVRDLTRVVLETTEEWTDAVAFYERCGFARTHVEIGRFGRDVHLARPL